MTSTTAFCLFLTRHLVASRHLFSVFVCLSACSSYKNCDTCVPHAKVRLSAVVRVYAINQTLPNLCSMQQTCKRWIYDPSFASLASYIVPCSHQAAWEKRSVDYCVKPHMHLQISINHSLSVFWRSFCCWWEWWKFSSRRSKFGKYIYLFIYWLILHHTPHLVILYG